MKRHWLDTTFLYLAIILLCLLLIFGIIWFTLQIWDLVAP